MAFYLDPKNSFTEVCKWVGEYQHEILTTYTVFIFSALTKNHRPRSSIAVADDVASIGWTETG